MKKQWLLYIGLAVILFSACCSKSTKDNSQSYVEIMGKAEKEVDPDIFYLSITLSENNASKSDISSSEQKLIGTLKSLNIDPKSDLTVTGMSGDNWYWWRKSRTVYQNKSYLLKSNDLNVVNKLCDKLDSMGNLNYYLSKVDYSKIDELKKEVQQEAVKQARIKAENLLSGENRKVGELVYLHENEIYTGNPMPMYNKQMAFEVADQASTVDFNKMKISYEVVARFSIK